MNFLELLAYISVWLVLVVIPLLCVLLFFREMFSLFFKGKFLWRRSNARFGLRAMFAVTTAVAVSSAIFARQDVRQFSVGTVLGVVISSVCLLCLMYVVSIPLTDLLEGFGWIKPAVDVPRFIAKDEKLDPEALRVIENAGDAETNAPPSAATEESREKGKKKKRRRWWTARKWVNRYQVAGNPFSDKRIPMDRDTT